MQEDYDRLTEALEAPIKKLAKKCRIGDAVGAKQFVKMIENNVDDLKKGLMK